MGLPFWEMPAYLWIGGKNYPIDTDFRIGIRIRQMMWEPYYAAHPDRLLDAVRHLLFRDGSIPDCCDTELLCAVVWYLLDGRGEREGILRRMTADSAGGASERIRAGMEEGEPVFSYLWDMPALYAAFLSVYRVDLLTERMHLWQFDALFAALPADCALCRTMAVRASVIDDAADPASRAVLAAQKAAVRIPHTEELHALYSLEDRP
jgi:hypothetical protein